MEDLGPHRPVQVLGHHAVGEQVLPCPIEPSRAVIDASEVLLVGVEPVGLEFAVKRRAGDPDRTGRRRPCFRCAAERHRIASARVSSIGSRLPLRVRALQLQRQRIGRDLGADALVSSPRIVASNWRRLPGHGARIRQRSAVEEKLELALTTVLSNKAAAVGAMSSRRSRSGGRITRPTPTVSTSRRRPGVRIGVDGHRGDHPWRPPDARRQPRAAQSWRRRPRA